MIPNYTRIMRYSEADGEWIVTIDELPEIEARGATPEWAMTKTGEALENLFREWAEEGHTLPSPNVPLPGAASPSLMPVWGISMIIMFLMVVVAVAVMAARCGWMPGGWVR